jgi:dihydrofolate reductase
MSSAAARGQSTMTRITAPTHATLDGVIDAAPAEAFQPYRSDEGMQATIDLAQAADALLLGRETWQQLAKAWRSQSGAIADRLNAMPKYVVSRTLESADDWDHTTIVAYDEIAGLRERLDLLSYGCGALARDLLRDGLLDELRLLLTPVVAGSGRRLFDEPGELLALELAEARAFPGGAVRLTYGPVQRA